MKNKFILAGLSLIISSFSLVSCNDENKDITITYHLEDELNTTKVETYKKGSKITELFSPSRVNGEYTFVNRYKDKSSATNLTKENVFYKNSIVNASIDVYAGWILTEQTGDWVNQVILDNSVSNGDEEEMGKVAGLRSYLGNYYVTDCVPFFYSTVYTHKISSDGSFYIYGENLDYSNIIVYKEKLAKAGYKINEVKKNEYYEAINPNYEFNLNFGVDAENNEEFYVKVSYLDDKEYKEKDKLPVHIFASEGRYVNLTKISSFDGVLKDSGKNIVSARTYLTNNGLPASVIYYKPDTTKKVGEDDTSNGVNYLANFLEKKLGLTTFNFSNSDGKGAMDPLGTFRIQMQYVTKNKSIQVLLYSLLNNDISYQYSSVDLSETYFGGLLESVPRLENRIYDTIFYKAVYNMNSRNGIGLNYFMINLGNDDLETYFLELVRKGWKSKSVGNGSAYLINPNDTTFIILNYFSKTTFLQNYPIYKNVNKGVIACSVGLAQFATSFPKDDINAFLNQNTRGEIPTIPEITNGTSYYFGKYKTQDASSGKVTVTETSYQLQIEMSNDISSEYKEKLEQAGWTVTLNSTSGVYKATSKDGRFTIQFLYSTNKTYGISYLVMVISYKKTYSGLTEYSKVQELLNYRFQEEVTLPVVTGIQDEKDFEVSEYYDGSSDRVLIHIIYHASNGNTAMNNAALANANILKAFENNSDWPVYDYNYNSDGVITQTFYKNESGLILYFINSFAHNYIGIYRERKI